MRAGERQIFGTDFKAKAALAAAKADRTTAQLASQFRFHTSQVTVWKRQLMAQVAELFAVGRQRRPDQTTGEQELHEQIWLGHGRESLRFNPAELSRRACRMPNRLAQK